MAGRLVDSERERIWKETIVMYLPAHTNRLCRYFLPERCQEMVLSRHLEAPQVVPWPRRELGTSRVLRT
jgi:hypothetical protein